MGSVGNPNPLGPYSSYYKDCSQGICSIYCPQWCYIIFPPPPGPFVNNGNSSLNSARPLLIIGVIGILATVFLLMTIIYIIITTCCSSRRRTRDDQSLDDQIVDDDQVNHEMAASSSTGLDEVSINSITVCKYKKGDTRDCCCSVCLSEFEEGDGLRVLPKCNHAFHLPCIDTWLLSHSNCPLCRSDIIITTSSDNVNLAALDYHYQPDTIVVVQDLGHTSVSIEQSSSCYH